MQFDEIARPAPGADVARAARQQPRVVDKNLRVSGVNGDPQVMVRIVSHPKPHIDVLIRIHRDDLSQGYEVRRRVHVRDQGVARETAGAHILKRRNKLRVHIRNWRSVSRHTDLDAVSTHGPAAEVAGFESRIHQQIARRRCVGRERKQDGHDSRRRVIHSYLRASYAV
jgi:hypothetical protein